ncbi:Fc.00g019320.m01.CDS01 [Cosmosporella sp. VM-42]
MQSLARPMLRSPAMRLAARRFESTTAQKAQEVAKDTATKAREGLSRVSSAAGPAIAGYAKGLGNALGKIGGRTGRLIGFVERQIPFVVYYSKVTAEVAKMVFHGQKMSPPSVATFQTYYQNALKSLQNRTFLQSPQNLLNQARNLSTTQVAAGGVILAECLGFFTVGEMIGRFKLIGYHGETGSHH